jgi:tRNA pseudouridine38-40 synthase
VETDESQDGEGLTEDAAGRPDDLPGLTPPGGMRFRLDLAYDGAEFTGWSTQPGLRTVQGELETALGIVFRRFGTPPSLVVAGRTDAGVHGLGQVAHLDLTAEQLIGLNDPHRGKTRRGPWSGNSPQARGWRLARRLNGIAGLNSDLYVTDVTPAADGFDARFSALWRRYEYRVADTLAPRNPLQRGHTLWYPVALDLAKLDAAAASLVGLHDFAAYCKPREGATTVRTLQEFRWERLPDGVLQATLTADAFCHSMVRGLVGATIAVAEGKLEASHVVGLLDHQKRSSDFKVMPAKGLALVEVGYPPDAELAARAQLTRRRRGPVATYRASAQPERGLTEQAKTD